MRRLKVVNIEGRGEVTVKEISPYALYQAWQSDDRVEELERLANECLDPGLDEIKTWYASEIEQVVDGLLEVNSGFFGIARKLRADGVVEGVAKSLSECLPSVFADSFRLGMSMRGITDGNSS
ncbi:MAG TPA: hypothetical protein ENI89_13275 [Desulfobulbus sp.]|nr:hypothetical protein [Desulfobulbus sp.]